MSAYISYLTPQSWLRAQKNRADLEKTNPTNPVLNEEDEQFLERITSAEGPAPPLPERPGQKTDDGAGVVVDEDGKAEVKPKEEVEKVEEKVKDVEEKASKDSTEASAEGGSADVVESAEVVGSSDVAPLDKEDVGAEEQTKDTTENEPKIEASEVAERTSAKALDKDSEPTDKKDEQEDKDARMSKSWASYIPSIPSLPVLGKKKDTTKQGGDSKADDQTAGDAAGEASAPKAKKAKTDGFPTQEEAEAATTAGISQASGAATSTSPTVPQGRQTEDVSNPSQRNWSSYIPSLTRSNPTDALDSAIKKGKASEAKEGAQSDDEKEVSVLLDHLNLSAINNRVFSFSADSQKVYENFTVVLKDIVNGGPTAYDDLEKLIKDNEGHLDQMFGNMPPFVQTLVKSLPTKVMGSLGPEVLAVMSEKPGADMQAKMKAESSSSASGINLDTKKKQKRRIPSAKALVTEQGAVASMLKSILSFLKLRFPAFVTGTNVLMSVAVFSKSDCACLSFKGH